MWRSNFGGKWFTMIVFVVWIEWNTVSFSVLCSTLFSGIKMHYFSNSCPIIMLYFWKWRCTKQYLTCLLNTAYMLITEVCHVGIWNQDSIPFSFRLWNSPWFTIKLNLLYVSAPTSIFIPGLLHSVTIYECIFHVPFLLYRPSFCLPEYMHHHFLVHRRF